MTNYIVISHRQKEKNRYRRIILTTDGQPYQERLDKIPFHGESDGYGVPGNILAGVVLIRIDRETEK